MSADKQERRRILIAEDEPMLAITLQELLIGAGFQIAGVAGKVEKAVALVESDACDAAILDANLSGVIASPVALALAARGLPFIMLSGYTPEQLPGAFSGALLLQKPCRPARLIQALNSVMLRGPT
jgi:DNA-binding response OmpR family regulator